MKRLTQFNKSLGAVASGLLLMGAAPDSPAPVQPAEFTYADLADLALAAPVAAHVRLKRSVALAPAEAGNVAAGRTRFYIVADVVALIQGAEDLPLQVSYLADVPAVNGKSTRLAKKAEYIVLARPVRGRPGELQLVSPDAHLPFTTERANTIRSILREAAATGAAPEITGIARAFHVAGTIPGESETQIFLQTADGRPVSLSILRRPGSAAQWAVSLSEVTDESAGAPSPNSLLWYRLACALPPAMPPSSFADAPESEAAIQADYKVVMDALGRCARNRS